MVVYIYILHILRCISIEHLKSCYPSDLAVLIFEKGNWGSGVEENLAIHIYLFMMTKVQCAFIL